MSQQGTTHEDLRTAAVDIVRALADAEATRRVMQAEWSRLNDPRHLQALAQKHLPLEPLYARQLVREEAR